MRPVYYKNELRPFFVNRVWLLRLMQIMLIPIWPIIFIPLILWQCRDECRELLIEIWDNIECIWARYV
jgi:hypothetical protein